MKRYGLFIIFGLLLILQAHVPERVLKWAPSPEHGLFSVGNQAFFWDVKVYVEGIRNTQPYNVHGTPFIYHPLILHTFQAIDKYVDFGNLLVSFLIVSILIFAYKVSKVGIVPLHVVLFSLVFGGVDALLSGNVVLPFHLLLIVALFYEHTKKQFYVSYFLILCVSLIKPYFLVYLALPLLINWNWYQRYILRSGLVVAIFAAIYEMYSLLAKSNDEVHAFLLALKYDTIDRIILGFSPYRWLELTAMKLYYGDPNHLLDPRMIVAGLLAHLLLVGFCMYLVHKYRKQLTNLQLLGLGYLLCTLISPRMMSYDFFPAMLCIFCTIQLSIERKLILLSLLSIPIIFTNTLSAEQLNWYTYQILTEFNLWELLSALCIFTWVIRSVRTQVSKEVPVGQPLTQN